VDLDRAVCFTASDLKRARKQERERICEALLSKEAVQAGADAAGAHAPRVEAIIRAALDHLA